MLQVVSYVAVYAVLHASPKCQVTKVKLLRLVLGGEVNELEADVGDVLSEVDHQANAATSTMIIRSMKTLLKLMIRSPWQHWRLTIKTMKFEPNTNTMHDLMFLL